MENMKVKERKKPKSSTFKRWKEDHSWLEYRPGMTMRCKMCISQKSKIELMKIIGASNEFPFKQFIMHDTYDGEYINVNCF